MAEQPRTALSILESNQLNEPIQQIFGGIIRKRLLGPHPECRLIDTLVSDDRNLLPRWRADFSAYINAIADANLARQKAEADLLGRAEPCSSSEFDNYWGDFYAEISVVNELVRIKRFKQFIPILPPKCGTYDYDAMGSDDMASIEVKNARSPITITDVFAVLLREHPEFGHLRVILQYYWDNTVTTNQRQQIETFIRNLKTYSAGYIGHLRLDQNVSVKVALVDGPGDVIMKRGMGGSCPEPELNEAGLIKKVSDQTEKAMKQLSSAVAPKKILAINLVTPDGLIDEGLALAVKATVLERSADELEPVLLLHHHLLSV